MEFELYSKHDKYVTRNLISQFLVANFFKTVKAILHPLSINRIVDVGCGEGLVLKYLSPNKNNIECHAIDLSHVEVEDAKKNLPFCKVQVGSVYEIPFDSGYADLVICSEVLEHLERPDVALKEINRVTNKFALLSVPNEPLWRILNMVRFQYLSDFGNTPGHKNHWSPKRFKNFITSYFSILESRFPIPWQVVLCEKKLKFY